MKMDSRGVSNVISFCNGMVSGVLAAIISCESNRTTTNLRGDCSKQYSAWDEKSIETKLGISKSPE
jgi:hypothetical protein